MTPDQSIYTFIAILSFLNLSRIFFMLIASDVYDMKRILARRVRRRAYYPTISVIIPAYNEEVGVLRTVKSVLANPYKNKEVIVVDDGSNDRTLSVLRAFQREHPGTIKIITQPNGGKAVALNRAILKWATGKLVMVLDADSILNPDGIEKMVAHFRNKHTIAAAANVKIIPTKKLFGTVQRFEYLISYRMKRALSAMNMEYIIGGVGSTFRRSALVHVGGYDTDTMTEDIDLTVKLIREYGNRSGRIQYAADCIAYTEHVLNFRSLIRQRFRWKYGRLQTFVKNYQMFFSRSKNYDKRLTWYQFPYAIFGELILLIEPLLVLYIVYVTIQFADTSSLLSVYLIVTGFIFLLLVGEHTEKLLTKVTLAAFLPAIYFLMYILSAVELIALLQSIKKIKPLLMREKQKSSWEHVERTGETVIL
jgi:biofilm PGA synthesis N-glycosyltransferase PgaC